MTPDDESIGFDLEAWEAPPAPDVTDAVLARLREPVRGIAIEAAPARRARWWIAGAAAAAAIAGAVVLAQRESPEPLTGSGAVVTTRPSRIDLGAMSTAVLEADTDVHWVRDGHRLVAMQPRGTATWQVAADDKLLIDVGAAVAHVSASGANLRVEVDMNITEARRVGASAVTAAVVALVTVVVYEGRVEVTADGQTTAVPAGSTVEIHPGKPPAEPPVVAGKAVQPDPRQAEIDRLEQEILRLQEVQKQLLATAGRGPVPPVAKQPVTPASVHDGKFKSNECVNCHVGTGATIRRDATSQPLLAVHGPKGRFPLAGDHANVPCAACHKATDAKGKITFAAIDRTCTTCHPKTAQIRPLDCSDTARIDQTAARAEAALASGNFVQALPDFEGIVRCRPALLAKTYLAACRVRSFEKAKAYFHQLPAGSRTPLAQICIREGFDPR